jgi:hypothetical protein
MKEVFVGLFCHFGRAWRLQAAKANLSELVKRAQREGPQEITVWTLQKQPFLRCMASIACQHY